jgi:hypothetical protein
MACEILPHKSNCCAIALNIKCESADAVNFTVLYRYEHPIVHISSGCIKSAKKSLRPEVS